MSEPIPFKPRPRTDDYPTITKIVNGEKIELVDIDSLTEAQFKKYCSDTGTEWFQRMLINI